MTREPLMAETQAAKTYQVTVRRDGKWWYFEIPEIDMSGQAHRLTAVEFEAVDIIATWLQVDAGSITVELDVEVPADVTESWSEAKRRETVAREENAAAAVLARQAVQRLRDAGMSQAEAGRLLGVSVQRVSQLEAASAKRRAIDRDSQGQ
jgi:predicted XRE-type DNA-binding protein